MPSVDADELQHPFHRLQNRHIDVEIHSIDPFQLKQHMPAQYLRCSLCHSKIQLLRRFASHGSVINSTQPDDTLHARRSEAKPRWCSVSLIESFMHRVFSYDEETLIC